MTLYHFKTRTSCFFPELNRDTRFIFSLYGNYGGVHTRIYWWLFLHSSLFRSFFKVDSNKIEDYTTIQNLVGTESTFGINMGTKGLEQKRSILGIDKKGDRFFAKFSQKDKARQLSENEILIYKRLADTGLTPVLLDTKKTDDYTFLKCECITGNHVKDFVDEHIVLKVLNTLKSYHIDDDGNKESLKTCLAHNDFCLWNMLEQNGKIKLVDWEMAEEAPLGRDLFTYIFQVSFFVWNHMDVKTVYERHKSLIENYFNERVEKWKPYLMDFIEYKLNSFEGKNSYATARFMELKEFSKELI